MGKGYTNRNKLMLILDIQRIYRAHSRKQDGNMTDIDIYNKLIEPVYHISISTFYKYLGEPAAAKLRAIPQASKKGDFSFQQK